MTAPGLRFGAECPLQVVMFQPLFEEYNRCRRLLCEFGRRLEANGIGMVLAELPGTGESLIPIGEVSIAEWRATAGTIAAEIAPVVIASSRGGALIDDAGSAKGWWRFTPESGTRVVRDLRRTALTGESGLYGGHALSDGFIGELDAAEVRQVARARTVRLDSDARSADAKLPGSPLWRRAEPGEDDAMAAAMAADLVGWVRQCAAS